MVEKAPQLTALRKGFSVVFNTAMKARMKKERWPRIARRVRSDQSVEVFGIVDAWVIFKHWAAGQRRVGSIKEKSYEIPSREYEGTIGLKRPDVRDDKWGLYRPIMEEIGMEASEHVDYGCFQALKNGRTNLCMDGKAFFATDHPVNADVDGTGANTPTSNILLPAVTSNPEWYLLCADGMRMPVIYVDREPAEFDMVTNPRDSEVFKTNVYLMGGYARRGFGYGRWQTAVSSRAPLNNANFYAAFQMIESFKRDGGRPWGFMPTILVVPTALRAVAEELIEARRLANGASNTAYGKVELLVEPLLS